VELRRELGLKSNVKNVAWPIASAANRPLAQRRLLRTVHSTPPPYKLNVGAGNGPLDGWINTDVGPKASLYLDATRPWPFPLESVSHVYADNVIEHIPFSGARRFFTLANSHLAPRGLIRLVTPDAERTARIYLDDPLQAAAHLERHQRHGYSVTYPVELLRVIFSFHGHHLGYVWDFGSMKSELERAGFADVVRCEVGQSDEACLRGLERRSETTDALTMLVVEARKPEAASVST
jgi:predicted SAM-dependent methyltransferase